MGVGPGLLLGDPALVDQALDERVVLGDLADLAVPEQVGAAVTDVAEGELLAVEQRDGGRGAGAAEARVVVDDLGDPVVGPVQGARDGAAQVGVRPRVELAELADGGAGGQVSAGGPADAVADGDHPRAGVAGVLVVLADPAHVGDRGVAQTERHRLLPQLDHRLADTHLRAERERGRLGDPDGPDVGAVGRAEVLDEPLVARRGDPGVPGGDVVVVEADRGVLVRGRSGSGRRSRSARSPWLSPSTTSTWVGAPRRALAGLGGRGLRWAAACRAPSGIRAPNMSERITDSAESTKIHRIAR